MLSSTLRQHGHTLLLLLVVAIALIVRLYGQDWDQGTYQHPDERFIATVSADRLSMPEISDLGEIFDPANSPINPRRDGEDGSPLSFAYGSLPLYVQGTVSAALNLVSDRDWGSYSELYRVGRTLTAIVDTLTVLVVYVLGRRLFGRAAGLIAAGLYALSVLAIQLSHFFAVDSWLTLFVTAALYLVIRFMDRPTFGRSLVIGAVLGLAFATKASVPSLLVPVFFGYAYVFWKSPRKPDIVIAAASGAFLSLAVFTLFEPYALIRSAPFIHDIRTQARIVRGETDIPFTRQFVGLTPGIYELKNLFAYTIGPGFLLGSIAGTIFAIRRALTLRDVALAVPLLWILSYIPVLITTEARFLRYSLPLLPTLAVLTAGLLIWLSLHPRLRLAGQIAAVVVLGVTALWAAGFMTIYSQEHPRIAASKWIHENVPPGSVLTAESWDDPLPTRYPDSPSHSYEIQTLDIYGDQPPDEKADYFHEALQGVDYVILSSSRLIDSVANLPWRYAVQNEYYRRLTDGQLGYQLVYEGLVQPELFGYQFDDRAADESFTVYDHPHVRIYQKVEDLSRDEFRARLLRGIGQPWEPQRYPGDKWLMLDEPVSEIPTNHDSGWNRPAVGNGLLAALSWILAIELIGLSVLPLAATLLRRSPDRGAFSTRLLGIVIVGWLVWIGASVGFWTASVWSTAIVLVALSAVSWGYWLSRSRSSRRPILPSRASYLAGAIIYAGLFLLFLTFRALYPDFWQTYYGGEKPFELAYLRAVAGSAEFPPYDPWYAGGFINYYYYGWHLVASVTKLSGVGISMGFQLAAATLAALVGLQCFAVTGLLARRGRRGWLAGGIPIAGFLTAFLVLFAGNLDGLRQLVEHGSQAADRFDFWRSTRVIDYTINEFPYFSQIWADVHPHVINLPIYVLLLTLLAHLVVEVRYQIARGRPESLLRPLHLFTIALVLGTICVTNSWDAPLAAGLTVGAFLYAGILRGGWNVATGLGTGLLVAVAALALFAPFYSHFYSVVDGVATATEGSSTGQFVTHWGIFMLIGVTVTVSAALRNRLSRHGANSGMLVGAVCLAGGGLTALVLAFQGSPPALVPFITTLLVATTFIVIGATVACPERFRPWLVALTLVFAGATGILAPVRPAASLIAAIATVAVMFALRHWRHPQIFIPWALVAIACVTIAAVELLHVADDLQNSPWERMNTVFKFYLQAWLLFGVGAAVLLSRVLSSASARSRSRPTGFLAMSVLGFALLAGLIYPVFGTPARLSQNMESTPSSLTLDGYGWMEGGSIQNATGDTISFAGDLAAIEWLNANTSGTPVLLEAAIGPYRGNGSRISSATGLPTVLGWDRHQRQQRYEAGISQRMQDVQAIYNETDPDEKLEELWRYGVRYVIVGDVERYWNTPEDTIAYASEAGLQAFEDLIGRGLTLVFEANGTIVYQVEEFPRVTAATPQ